MEFKTALFYLFAVVLVFAALRVITARNPVHAVLFLVLAFFNAAGLWILLQAEFLAISLVMVYVGAVMVLFLFVVMMLDINIERVRQGFWQYLPLGAIIGAMLLIEMIFLLVVRGGGLFGVDSMPSRFFPAEYDNTKELARLLFTDYFFPFELASMVLLVAVIAAVMLTLRKRNDSKAMHPSDQLAVKRSDRIRIVRMASEKEQGG